MLERSVMNFTDYREWNEKRPEDSYAEGDFLLESAENVVTWKLGTWFSEEDLEKLMKAGIKINLVDYLFCTGRKEK